MARFWWNVSILNPFGTQWKVEHNGSLKLTHFPLHTVLELILPQIPPYFHIPPRSTTTASNSPKLSSQTKYHTSYFYFMKIKRFHQYNYNLLPIDFPRSSKIIKIGWKRNIFEVRAFTYVYMFAVPWLKI